MVNQIFTQLSVLMVSLLCAATGFAQVGRDDVPTSTTIEGCSESFNSTVQAESFNYALYGIYMNHLGRAPDYAGANFYACHYVKGNISLLGIEDDIASSDEANERESAEVTPGRSITEHISSTGEVIEKVTVEINTPNQNPVVSIDPALVIDNCSAQFENRQEYRLFNFQVTAIYRDHLHRNPDKEGFSFYACHFAKGNLKVSEIEKDIASSEEAQQLTAQNAPNQVVQASQPVQNQVGQQADYSAIGLASTSQTATPTPSRSTPTLETQFTKRRTVGSIIKTVIKKWRSKKRRSRSKR